MTPPVPRITAIILPAPTATIAAVGYAQFARALEDADYSVEQAIEDTTIATRQFARRQLTWFRADPRVHWLDALSPTLADEALATILQK